MSGIVALANRDGAPIDCGLLGRMTDYLTFRGPDGDAHHVVADHVGFGYTHLELTDSASAPEQPFTIDGCCWIVADARIDARGDLVTELLAGGQHETARDASDVELILRAYQLWGEDCPQHLIGDFSFAIWDHAEQRLFCARDQLGVKPLFYAECGPSIVLSNTLDCLRLHPGVSRRLNDESIADFLLFGATQDHAHTSFRDILRVPPAHSVTFSKARTDRRRYWTLAVDEPIHFTRADDYSARFTELLHAATRDRLRTQRVGVLMSGGIDSTSIAAAAVSVLRERNSEFAVQAVTSVYDRLIPDSERYYAGLAARHLDIPIRYDVRDDEISIAQWDQVSVHTPEPVDNPAAVAASDEFLKKVAADVRVLLYGEGPDNALQYEWRPYLAHLLAARRVGRLARSVFRDLVAHRRVPLWGSIRSLATARSGKKRWMQAFPEWLDDDFSARLGCRERWDAAQRVPPSDHPVRPAAYRGFGDVQWRSLFEDCDLAAARTGTEFRHPFLDLRLLRYMLAVPTMPWCRNKLIIRRAMRRALPAEVLQRRKTSIPVSPDLQRVLTCGFPRLAASPDLRRYVNPDKVPTAPRSPVELRAALRPLGLSYWLNDLAAT